MQWLKERDGKEQKETKISASQGVNLNIQSNSMKCVFKQRNL